MEINPEKWSNHISELVNYNKGWGFRLKHQTMEMAAESAAFSYLEKTLIPERFMPTVGGWSIQYQVIAGIVDTIMNTDKENLTVVELGSGVSTSWIALALKRAGKGEVISVDHEPLYANRTASDLRRLNLTAYSSVVCSPLENHGNSVGSSEMWYGLDPIRNALGDRSIDVLLVDGPPGNLSQKSRSLAFPLLVSNFSHEALLILDDTDRKAERDVMLDWQESNDSKDRIGILAHEYDLGRSSVLSFMRDDNE